MIDGGEIKFSSRIKELRLSRNLNQVQLAEVLGVTKQSVSNWENDNIMPSIEMLVKISVFFSVSTDYILGLQEKKYIDVSHLKETEIAHLRNIVEDLSKS